ncbi:Macro domain-containing protein MM_0177 [Azospirillaceae bacterium]
MPISLTTPSDEAIETSLNLDAVTITTIERIHVVRGDITRQNVEAIINAANNALLRGGGVDGAIHRAAGPGLQKELNRFGGCPTGECRITGAHQLTENCPNLRRIIHCVGPVWRGGDKDEDRLLESCYRAALSTAREHAIRSLAFPAISAGVYGFPRERAAAIAVAAVLDELSSDHDSLVQEVRLVCFDTETEELLQTHLQRIRVAR